MSWRLAALLGLTGVLSACAVNPPLDLSDKVTSGATHVVLDVPFFAQEENQCGPAALATVLGASGLDLSPDQLTPEVYLPERQGSLQAELMAATRRAGRIPYRLSSAPEAIIAEIQAGRPVLVLQNLRVRSWPAWHYAVVTGFDTVQNRFTLNSGASQGLEISAPHFLRTWNWGGNWAVVTLRPGQLPARPEPQPYFRSVADFEAVAGAEMALAAWRAGATRWPNEAVPDLALGNIAHAHGKLREAARHYSNGLAKRPQDAVLANNLATVLGEMGCPQAGERILAPFLAGDGGDSGWADALKKTARELETSPGENSASCPSAPSLPGSPPATP